MTVTCINNQFDFKAGTSGLLLFKSIGRQNEANPRIRVGKIAKTKEIKF